MTFKLVIFAGLLAIAKAGYINGGHAIGGPTIGPYVSNGGLLRTGSQSYSSGYGYPLTQGRSYSGSVIVRPSGYGSPYPYGSGRNSGAVIGVNQNYQSISGNYGGSRALQSSYPSPTYSYSSSPTILKASPTVYPSGFNPAGFSSGYNNNGYGSSNLQNFAHQPISYTVSPISHNNPHGNSFNNLATGYPGF